MLAEGKVFSSEKGKKSGSDPQGRFSFDDDDVKKSQVQKSGRRQEVM
jgi:hypothetical protein